jgi:outer membrane protein assembly factor BamA
VRALALVLGALLGAAHGAEPVDSNEEIAATAEAAHQLKKEANFVVLPVPRADPTLGAGLVLTAIALYNPTEGSRPWITGVGGLATDNESRALAVFQKAYLMQDKLRLTAAIADFDIHMKFFGIGEDAGTRDQSIPIRQQGQAVLLRSLYRVAPNVYAGPTLRYIALQTSAQGTLAGVTVPAGELDLVTSGLGLMLEYDTRDNEQNPQHGSYATLDANFPRQGFGSDRNYEQFRLRANRYQPLAPGRILALRASACMAGGDVPFFDLCMFGVGPDLRGYVGGQYRDKAMLAAQAEYRWQLSERWGVVGFVGAGSVAPTLTGTLDGTVLPSVGAGVRFLASKLYKVNVSADVARGRDDIAFYFRIGEAF